MKKLTAEQVSKMHWNEFVAHPDYDAYLKRAGENIRRKHRYYEAVAREKALKAFIDGNVKYKLSPKFCPTEEKARQHCLNMIGVDATHILAEFLTTGYFWDDYLEIRC